MTNTAQLVQLVGSVFNIPTADAADAAVGTTAPLFAIQIGAVDGLGHLVALNVDGSGNLKVTGAGGSGSNAAAGPTGSAVPSSADYLGVNIGGSLVGVTGFSLTGAKAAAVALVDGSGNQITSFGGGVQFADNAASGATPTGTLSMAWDSANSKVRALKASASQALIVDGSAVTQPVSISGSPTVTVGNASIAVTGTFFQATQPVSIAAPVAVTGTFFQATQPVSIAAAVTVAQATAANLNATVTGSVSITGTPTVTVGNASLAVTGAFFQATQPVSIAAAVAVTGTFFQATQPVSIASAVAVTGTFFQATQPVSAASGAFASGSQVDITNMQVAGGGTTAPSKISIIGGKTNDGTPQYNAVPLGASGRSVIVEGFAGGTAVPVSGTFFQATQPVSIASAVAVTGTFFQATQPVSLATLPALTAGSAVIGHVIVDTAPSTAVTNAGTFAVQATLAAETTKVIGTINIASAQVVSVLPPTLTKATQGSSGFSTQDLKDAGRSARTIFLDSFAVAATAETLMTMSYSSDNATVTTGTSYAVTTAKRLRLQSILVNVHTITGNTTAVNVIVRLRVNNAGTALVTSPVQMIISVQGIAAANQAGIPVDIPIPDGWEFVAGAGIGVTVACAGFVATTAAPKVDISIIGYEY